MDPDGELPERARAWLLAAVPAARGLNRVVPLFGGLSAFTHGVEVEREGLEALALVLKRLKPRPGQGQIAVEVEALRALADRSLGFAVPALVAHDAVGDACDLPALLMTRVPGRIALALSGWEERVAALGRALAQFHAAEVPCPPSIPQRTSGLERRDKPVPEGIAVPDWARVWPQIHPDAGSGDALLHGDYHIGNTLFEGDALTGVIDWASARRGPTQFDVCYCRLDLSLVIGPAAPGVFLAAYESERGAAVAELARWDLTAAIQAYPDPAAWLPGWLDAGRTDLTPELVRARLAEFIEKALVRC